MDYVSNAATIRAIMRTLENDVIPVVPDAHARGQLWACAGLLGNIANELEALPRDGNRAGPVGTDLEGYLAEAGLDGADANALRSAAGRLERELAEVIGSHSSLHYRRAIDGFSS